MAIKNIIKISIVIIIIGIISVLLYNIAKKKSYKESVISNINELPSFCLKDINNSMFTQEDIIHNTPIVFIYFNTECDFCQYEIKSIKRQRNKFKDITIIFISPEATKEISIFAKYNGLADQNNIVFLQDSILGFATQIDANIIPTILIYNKDRKLIKRSKGLLKVDSILKIIKNEN